MDKVETILNIVTWPLAAIVVGVVAIFVLRTAFVRLVDRVKKVTIPGGAAFHAGDGAAQANPAAGRGASDGVMDAFAGQLVKDTKDSILGDPILAGATDPSDRENALVTVLAANKIQLYFEQIYVQIFGSQQVALSSLNSRGTLGAPAKSVRDWYDEVLAQKPELEKSFEDWMDFMVSRGLVDLANDHYRITLRGHEFLRYLVTRGYPMKPY